MLKPSAISAFSLLVALSAPLQAHAGIVSGLGGMLSGAGNWLIGVGAKMSQPVANATPAAAVAATTDPCDPVAEQQAVDQQAQALANQVQAPKNAISSASCLDNLKNFSISGGLGLPSLSGILSSLESQACSALSNIESQVAAPLNQSLWLPGGAGVNVSALGGGAQSGVNLGTTTSAPSLPVNIPTTNLGIKSPSLSIPNLIH